MFRSPFKLLLLDDNSFLEFDFSLLFLFFPSLPLNRLKFLLLPLQLLLYVKLEFLFKSLLGRNYSSLQHSSLKVKVARIFLKFLVLGIGQTLTVEVLVQILEEGLGRILDADFLLLSIALDCYLIFLFGHMNSLIHKHGHFLNRYRMLRRSTHLNGHLHLLRSIHLYRNLTLLRFVHLNRHLLLLRSVHLHRYFLIVVTVLNTNFILFPGCLLYADIPDAVINGTDRYILMEDGWRTYTDIFHIYLLTYTHIA